MNIPAPCRYGRHRANIRDIGGLSLAARLRAFYWVALNRPEERPAMMRRFAPLLLPVALAACGQPRQLYVDHAYVRLPAVAGRPGVAYFTIHGGPAPATLISVSSPVVVRSELHETMTHGSMSSMAPMKEVSVPARATLQFAPGGRHAMLFDINKQVEKGGTIKLVFTFSNSERIEVEAPVIGAGDAPPK